MFLDTRWVASSARSVRAIWNNNKPLYIHFETAANDDKRTSTDRAQYKGLIKILTSKSFILNMGLVLDALIELESLSLSLQNRQTRIIKANKLLEMK